MLKKAYSEEDCQKNQTESRTTFEACIFTTVVVEYNTRRYTVQTWLCNMIWEDILNRADNQKGLNRNKIYSTKK